MRALDPDLAAHLKSGATTLAMCWRIERADGVVLGFTDHDRTLTVDGISYDPVAGADGAAIASSADLAIDNSEIFGAFDSSKLSASDLAVGKFDGAEVQIWRVNWADTGQRVLLKRATIGETVREGGAFRAELRGASYALSRTIGRVYQRSCDATIGDDRCGVDLDLPAYHGAGTITSLIDDTGFIATGLSAFENNWFAHGLLTWQTGANAGLSAHVKASHPASGNATRLDLWVPPGAAPENGDTFSITTGCDKRDTTCRVKFGNLINFRGFHLMPGDDVALQYPIRTEDNDGGKR